MFFQFYKMRDEVDNWLLTYLLFSSFLLLMYDLILKKIFKRASYLNFPTRYKNGYTCYRPITDFTNMHDERLYRHLAYNDYMQDFQKNFQYSIDIKEDDNIIDIGAHIGTFSVYLATLYPKSKVYIYEADEVNFNLINKSIKINKLNNIKTFHNAAYCESYKKIIFSKGLSSTTGSIGEVGFFKQSSKALTYEVQTISLADIFLNNNIKKCKIFKIDCEGCEYGLFKDDETLNSLNKVEYLFIELHKTKNNQPSELIGKLEAIGFEFCGNFEREYAWELFGKNKRFAQ